MISTHVLDTARGLPAEGITVRLYRVEGEERPLIATGTTNADGRVSPLFGGELEGGEYALVFSAGDYFERNGVQTIFNEIPVRFVAKRGHKYHIPLLLSPHGYSTYRGS